MPCYHPMVAYRSRSGRDPSTGKWPIVFNSKEGYLDQKLSIPCGKCIGCRLERSRQWAIRCVHEASLHDHNCFITLTYNNENLIRKCGIYDEEIDGIRQYSLNKEDYVLFMKRLRKDIQKRYGKQIRFFHCGEYGERFSRPHHHACIFGFDFPDKVLWSVRAGVKLYRSESLEKIWGLGYCVIGNVTFESAAYVSRYVTKKITGSKADDHYDGRQPEYITMSRNPGIGSEWFEKYKKDVLCQDKIIMRGGLTMRPPKYYDNKYDLTNPKEMEVIKRRRKKLISESNTTPERLAVREELQKLKSMNLKRHLEASHG